MDKKQEFVDIEKKDILLMASGACATILLILASFITIQNRAIMSQIDQIEDTTQQNMQETKDTTTSDTSDWKTYTNEEYGFEFEYPANWGLGSRCDGDKNNRLVARLGEHLLNFPGSDCGTGNIPSTIMVFVKSNAPVISKNYTVEQKDTTFGEKSIQYSKYRIVDRSQAGSNSIFQFNQKKDEYFIIIETGSYPISEEIFSQILSTFSFIESDATDVQGVTTDSISCLTRYSDIISEISQCESVDELSCFYYKGVFDNCNESCLKEASEDECLRICMPVCEN